jgi:hypothetical protein
MMGSARTALVVAMFTVVLASSSANADVTRTVVDLPTLPGVTQRILYVRPDNATATIVMLPGGDGRLGIMPDGTMTTLVASCNPVARNLDAFAARGLAVALVDQASDGGLRRYADVREVVRYVRSRANAPSWVMGGSASTSAALNFAVDLPPDEPMGLIIFSPVEPDLSRAALIERPALVVYHTGDFLAVPYADPLFNALSSVPAKERVALSGGTDGGPCNGYHLFLDIDAAFVATVGGFIDTYNATLVDSPPMVNVQGLWWAAGGGESGWGINFAHAAEQLFATWYTYDNAGKTWWLSMLANRTSGATYTGPIYVTTGSPFNATPFPPVTAPPTQVGIGTVTFSDGNNGSFAYTVNGVAQTKTIGRYDLGTGPQPMCSYSAATPNFAAATNYQDLWWVANGAESGWGINFAHQGNSVFATWYTYDDSGSPLWLSVLAGRVGMTNAYTGTLYRTSGPQFDAYDAAKVVPVQAGTATLTFADGNRAAFDYATNGDGGLPIATQSKQITRFSFAATGGTLCQ